MKKRLILFAASAVIITALIPGTANAQTPLPAAVTVLDCGRLLDVRTGKIERDQRIVIEGERIVAVGASQQTEAPAQSLHIDLRQVTCLPGLLDMHTHLADSDGTGNYSAAGPLQLSGAEVAFRSIPHARATLAAGFTTVRDVGTFRAFTDVALRDAIDKGIVDGPRIVPAGAYVTISGGAGAITGLAPDIVLPLDLRFGQADGADQVRQRVREIIRHGAGVIKVLATGAVLTLHSQPGAQEFSYDELRAAVEEAGKAGLKVACHAHGAAGAKDAIRAGVASIEHGSFLDDEALRMMKERGTFLVADLYDDEVILQRAGKSPDEYIEKEKIAGQSQIRVTQRALAMGVRIAFGTDAAVIPHGDNGKQFAVYVKYGFTPIKAIQTATIEAADLLGWADRVGAVEKGKFADIIAVRENPLENIATLEHMAFVMKGGKVYRNETR
ncbi:MAG: amidohydrolase family protein [Acidipila sp.]|nr:amidohydrolase family protein [Acidipila sp.]